MDLKEFTKQTLVQIVEGALEANNTLSDLGARIITEAPQHAEKYLSKGLYEDGINVIDVDFDVAITATESEGANGGGGLKVASFLSLGGSTESKTENQIISRVKYTLPLVLEKCTNN